ncbi:MAG: UDP-N-acetylglucosamine 2-epimerase (non-hydrolyzing) [Planctomycetes bacterium]|nr:UDP-N-acetylglucosamine 2-epimerase (non-hydrolyzing) [Planctomycetota bacterium]
MKVAPIHRAMGVDGRLAPRLVHTGQHYDPALSDQVMQDLELPAPDHHLGVGSGHPSHQLARILESLDPIVAERKPAAVMVVGDVTSTVAAGLVAANREVPLVHVEAGLRSFDWTMPEERNRIVVDRLSQFLFVTEPSGLRNLENEGMTHDGVHLVGNVMIDSLLRILPRARAEKVPERLGLDGPYAVLTMHRPGNVDDLGRFRVMFEALGPIAERAPVIFPVHPRTRPMLASLEMPAGFRCIDPLRYLDFIGLVERSTLVLTDSGGLQEETTVLGVPCITLRPNTERPITIEIGTNELVDSDAPRIRALGESAFAGQWKKGSVPELWDGHAAERIVAILAEALG